MSSRLIRKVLLLQQFSIVIVLYTGELAAGGAGNGMVQSPWLLERNNHCEVSTEMGLQDANFNSE